MTSRHVDAADKRQQTLASFDWQWTHLAAGDLMPGDPWFDTHATVICAEELCGLQPSWFRGKRVLDAGCGQGRWTRALLELGSHVTAVDFSVAGLSRTRALCGDSTRLVTRQVDLLAIPEDLAGERFDLVFSFGVLHHTSDTWSALESIAALVAPRGALALYLYGKESWSDSHAGDIESLRSELAALSFDEKIRVLRQRFPGDDPHQLFDLISPTINDRLHFHDVDSRLRSAGFDRLDRTIESGELYVRATRPGFPEDALRGGLPIRGRLDTESAHRWAMRRAAARELSLRDGTAELPARPLEPAIASELDAWRVDALIDASFPPDRIPETHRKPHEYRTYWPSLVGEMSRPNSGHGVIHIGATVGASGYTERMLERLAAHARGGRLMVELPAALETRRSVWDKIRDRKLPLSEKVVSLLTRHPTWSVGEALHALAENRLTYPISLEAAERTLERCGARQVRQSSTARGTVLLIADIGG